MNRPDLVVLALLGCSLSANAWMVRELRSRPVSAAVDPGLAVGTAVPTVDVPRRGGGRITPPFTNRPTILYAFSPRCVWCDKNLDNIRALVKQTSSNWNFIAIALDDSDLESYVTKHQIESWPLAVGIDAATRRAFHLGNTPQTIVVAPGGRVTNVWTGAFVGNVAKEVEATFGVTLPGLTSSK